MDLTLVAVVAIALFFDFTNGFHDTANSIATSVSTRALSPRIAVIQLGDPQLHRRVLLLQGRGNRGQGNRQPRRITLKVVLAGLVGAITWNLITWYLGLPSSSSHALIGGIVGSAVAKTGGSSESCSGLAEGTRCSSHRSWLRSSASSSPRR